MKKIIIICLILISGIFFISNKVVLAEGDAQPSPEYVKARVIRILEEKTLVRENEDEITQQNIELLSLGGESKGETLFYQGISEIDVLSSGVYKEGDVVFVSVDENEAGERVVYISNYVREKNLLWLFILFLVVVIVVGGKTGWRSILALAVSFFLIMKFLAPLILAGYNPMIVGPLAAFLILISLVYITEGFNIKAHISIASIFSALLATFFLSWFFVKVTRLSGTSNDEVMYLISENIQAINFQGLLLAAIIIGALGVLDDIAVGQVEAVEQLIISNPEQGQKKLFTAAVSIGRAHLGAIINTLFLAYVGAALPLILLFNIKNEPFLSFFQVINHEEIATEVVRTLVGVIGLCLAMPIATFLAILILSRRKRDLK
jgi:uncharacterized membrane protein